MPAYSFKESFIAKIRKGQKTQTIRSRRKHQAKPGDTIYLYFGMRTKWCMKIGEGTCTKVQQVSLSDEGVLVDGVVLGTADLDAFAKADGFNDWGHMRRWWRQYSTLPFHGEVIHWELKSLA